MNACWISGEILLTSTDIIIRLYKHFWKQEIFVPLLLGMQMLELAETLHF